MQENEPKVQKEKKKKKHTEKCPNMQDQMIKYQDKFQKK